MFRTQLYKGLVQRNARSYFNFKYVPQIDKKTAKEEHEAHRTQKSYRYLDFLSPFMAMGPIELVFLSNFIMTSGLLLAAAFALCLLGYGLLITAIAV